MVDGADELLDYLTTDGMYVTIDVSLEDNKINPILLELVAHDEIGGTYHTDNLRHFTRDIWLCNVVHYLFGEHPDNIYIKVL